MADLFSDGFESGDLTAWSSTSIDGGDLSAETTAKLHGNYGLNCFIDDTTNIFVRDDTPSAETRYRWRCYIDPNTLTMADTKEFNFFAGRASNSWIMFFIKLRKVGTAYKVWFADRSDGAWNNISSYYEITDAPHCVEMDWKASTGAGNNDGFLSLWVDGVLQETLSSIDSDTEDIDHITFGAFDIGTNISDTFYLDDFASNNDGSEIGSASTTHQATLEGTLNVAGSLIKTPTKICSGTLNTAGTLVKKISFTGLAGVLNTAGSLNKGAQKIFTGTLNVAGSLIKKPIKILSGTLNVAGTLVRLIKKTFTGTLNVAGVCNKKFCQLMEGTLTVSGTLNKTIHKVLLGTLRVRGVLRIFAWSRVLKTVLSWTDIAKGALSWTKIDKPENDWTEEE